MHFLWVEPLETRVVKRSSKIRGLIYKFEFEFHFLAFAIRSVIVPRGVHSINCTTALSTSVTHGCMPSTDGRRGYVIVTATVDSQRDMTRLVQLPSFFHPWTAADCMRECSRPACALKRGQRSVMLMPAVTPGRACTTAAAY